MILKDAEKINIILLSALIGMVTWWGATITTKLDSSISSVYDHETRITVLEVQR